MTTQTAPAADQNVGVLIPLELRAKQRETKRAEPVRCIVDAAHDAVEIRLDENVTHTEMPRPISWKRFALNEGRGSTATGSWRSNN